jgi:hypothetical protein
VLTAEDRAAARAFVARCEVRMSTLHRIAVGMLSGAGLLVVLPVVARDSVTGILRSLVSGGIDTADGFLMVAVVAMLAVPVTALWWLFRDLTRFYFHANHLEAERGARLHTALHPHIAAAAVRRTRIERRTRSRRRCAATLA